MSESIEIYICRPGQALTDGRVEYGVIATRAEAEDDALERLRRDPSIGKIAYYAIRSNGDFKCLFTMRNPDIAQAVPKPPSGVAPRSRKPRGKKPMKLSLTRRMLNLLRQA